MKYFILAVRANKQAKWGVHFGSYDSNEVRHERYDVQREYGAPNTIMAPCRDDKQASIDKLIEILNTRHAPAVTYNIVTPESAEFGDFDESGDIYHRCDRASLRDCIDELFKTRTNAVDGIASIEGDARHNGGFITVCNSAEFKTGAQESRTLHFPEHYTQATQNRIIRLLGAK